MRFSGKKSLIKTLKVTKNSVSPSFLENAFLEKPKGASKMSLSAFLGLTYHYNQYVRCTLCQQYGKLTFQ